MVKLRYEKSTQQILAQKSRTEQFLGLGAADSDKNYITYLRLEARLSHLPDMPDSHKLDSLRLISTRTRGYAYILGFDNNEVRVVKPIESELEPAIAKIAAKIGLGPRQYTSLNGLIHEDYVSGVSLPSLEKNECTPERMFKIGKSFALGMRALHQEGVLVNDQVLMDNFGNSHLIIGEGDSVSFIDFGASLIVDHPTNLSDPAMTNLMRCDPFFSLLGAGDYSKESIKAYRTNLSGWVNTPDDLFSIDTSLIDEGLTFLSHRLPNVEAFGSGVTAGFSEG